MRVRGKACGPLHIMQSVAHYLRRKGVDRVTRDEVLEVLRAATDAFNAGGGEKQLTFAPETPLFGQGSPLDSLDLVLFLVEVEGLLAERFGLERPLSDDRAMSQQRSPFRTMETLAEYILSLEAGPNG